MLNAEVSGKARYVFLLIISTSVINFNLNYCFKMTLIVIGRLIDWFWVLDSVFCRAALLLVEGESGFLTHIPHWHLVNSLGLSFWTDDSLIVSCYCLFIIALLGTDCFGVASQMAAPRYFGRIIKKNSTIGKSNCLKHLTSTINCLANNGAIHQFDNCRPSTRQLRITVHSITVIMCLQDNFVNWVHSTTVIICFLDTV